MSEQLDVGTPVAGENVQPVETETEANAAETSDVGAPSVEMRDGKMYVDGVRVYTRDDTNRIAANAKKEAEHRMLTELEVDSFDQVKTVVSQLQGAGDTETGLNVDSLRDAVKKKEQTVEELRAELQRVKTDMVLKDHLGNLQNAMPNNWTTDQKSAVIDLMKTRDMLHIEGETFAIRSGDSFLTDESGERPDYAGAVNMIAKTLGLPTAKTGVATFDSDRTPRDNGATKSIDDSRMKNDPAYRSAYIQVRERNKNLSRSEITDAMVKKQMEGTTRATGTERMLYGVASAPQTTTKTRRK